MPVTIEERGELLALAAISPKRAYTRGRELAKRYGSRAMELLDAIADVGLERDPPWAAYAFHAARRLGPAPVERYLRFVERGALDERDLLALVKGPHDRASLCRAAVAFVENRRPVQTELIDALRSGGMLADVLPAWIERAKPEDFDFECWLYAKDETRRSGPSTARGR